MSNTATLTIGIQTTGAASAAKDLEWINRLEGKNLETIGEANQAKQEYLKWLKSEAGQLDTSNKKIIADNEEIKRQEQEKAKLEKERARQAHLDAKKEIADQEELQKKNDETNKKREEQNNSRKNGGGRTRKVARTGLAAVEAAMLVSSAIGTSRDRKGAQRELEEFSATNNLDSRVLTQQMDSVAESTNQSLSEVTNAFMLLNGLGLDASSDSLISYTKLAKGLGEDLSTVVLRVSSATDGHFRALTLAGIEVEQQGDELTLSYGKFSKTIKNTSADIQTAVQELAESEFKTAISEEEKTVGGAINRFTTNNEGVRAAIGEGFDNVLSVVRKIPFVPEGVDGAGNLIQKGINYATDQTNSAEQSVKILRADSQRQSSPDEDSRQRVADRFVERSKREVAIRDQALGTNISPKYIKMMQEFLAKPIDISSLQEGMKQALDTTPPWLDDLNNPPKASDNAPQSVFGTPLPSPASINLSDDAQKTSDQINETHKQTTEAHKLELDAQDANQKQSNVNRLEQETEHSSATGDIYQETTDNIKGQYKEQEDELVSKQNNDLATLEHSLKLEEDQVNGSYQRRLQIIKDNTPEGSEKQGKLTDKATSDFEGDMNLLTDQFMQEKEFTSASNAKKITMLEEFYNKRDEIINGFTALTGEKKKELQEKFAQDEKDTLKNLEESKDKITRASAEKTFNNVLGLTKKYAGEQSESYRVMFAATKAFAIADSIVNIQTGISDAVAKGFPQNIPLIAGVLSQASGIVSTIQGTNLSGAYDHGGMIPSGSQGIVGEYGPELVSGPAVVTSRRTTADREQSQNQTPAAPVAPPVVNIRQINAFDTGVIGDFLGSDSGEQVILNVIRRNPETLRSLAAA